MSVTPAPALSVADDAGEAPTSTHRRLVRPTARGRHPGTARPGHCRESRRRRSPAGAGAAALGVGSRACRPLRCCDHALDPAGRRSSREPPAGLAMRRRRAGGCCAAGLSRRAGTPPARRRVSAPARPDARPGRAPTSRPAGTRRLRWAAAGRRRRGSRWAGAGARRGRRRRLAAASMRARAAARTGRLFGPSEPPGAGRAPPRSPRRSPAVDRQPRRPAAVDPVTGRHGALAGAPTAWPARGQVDCRQTAPWHVCPARPRHSRLQAVGSRAGPAPPRRLCPAGGSAATTSVPPDHARGRRSRDERRAAIGAPAGARRTGWRAGQGTRAGRGRHRSPAARHGRAAQPPTVRATARPARPSRRVDASAFGRPPGVEAAFARVPAGAAPDPARRRRRRGPAPPVRAGRSAGAAELVRPPAPVRASGHQPPPGSPWRQPAPTRPLAGAPPARPLGGPPDGGDGRRPAPVGARRTRRLPGAAGACVQPPTGRRSLLVAAAHRHRRWRGRLPAADAARRRCSPGGDPVPGQSRNAAGLGRRHRHAGAAGGRLGQVSTSGGSGTGSGVVFAGHGYVLTNNHVVAPAPPQLQPRRLGRRFSDGPAVDADRRPRPEDRPRRAQGRRRTWCRAGSATPARRRRRPGHRDRLAARPGRHRHRRASSAR